MNHLDQAQLYQNRFNFTGPVCITHELHEANSQAYTGVDRTADVSTELKIFFPAITDPVVNELLALYPESDYTSPGLRFADMKQAFDLTGKNLALTNALNNNTWNGRVDLGEATHGTDQSYYWYSTYTLSSTTTTTTVTASNSSATFSAAVSASSSSTSSNSTTTTGPGAGGGGGGASTSVNATVAVMMQKYLMSFVLTGNPNTMWPDDEINWPLYGNLSTGQQIVFNETFTIEEDDLANDANIYWNKALWY